MTSIHTEVLQNQQFGFILDDNERPAIEFEGKQYNDMTDLVKAAPALSDPKNLRQFIHIANFLFTGLDFMIIEDNVQEYQSRYRSNAGKLTREYGIYDVSSLREPYLENGKLIFFAEKNSSGVPYKVICTFPFTSQGARCDYTLLPEAVER